MHSQQPRTTTWPRLAGLGLAVTAVAVTVAAAPGAAAPRAAVTRLNVYGGSAYGTSGHFGSAAGSNPSAASYMCTAKAPVSHGNTTSASNYPQVGTVGAVTTKIRTLRTSQGPATETTTLTHATNLASKIHATNIKTLARVVRTSHGYVETGQTTFGSLNIAGHAAPPIRPTADQTIAVPGVGTILLNHQIRTNRFGNHAITVIGMTLTVPKNNSAKLPAGRVQIGRGTATLHEPTFGNARGYAFGTQVHVGNVSRSGRTALVTVPCGGTSGATKGNHVQSGSVPNALTTGQATSSSRTKDTANSTVVRTANTINNANLFGGKLKARNISVSALVSGDRSGAKHRSTTAKIGGLRINGTPKSGSAPANTKMTIPNLGTVWIHRVIRTPNGIQVRGLDVVLSVTKNGFKKGTEFVFGVASAGISPQ